MKSKSLWSIVLVGSVLLSACSEPASQPPALDGQAAPQLPEGHPDISQAPTPMGDVGPAGMVLETMDAAGYTYVRIDVEGEEIWAAGPPAVINVGDSIGLVGAMGMRDFTSNTLGRTFDQILFVSAFTPPGGGSELFTGNSGLVTETMDAAGYTYVLVEIEGQTMWLAGPQTTVEVGQTVGWMDGNFMQDFVSTTLDRTFEAILFVGELRVMN